MPYMLSEHLSFEEMTDSALHPELVTKNRVEARAYMPNMCDFARFRFEPLRAQYGPIIVDCGFRGPELNKAVGGVPTSLHCYGHAADLRRPDWTWEKLGEVMLWLKRDSGLTWGEVIREKRTATGSVWLHFANPAPGNHMEMWDGIDKHYTAWK